MVSEFKTILVKKFDAHCDSGLFTLKYHLFDIKVEALRRLRTLSVLDISPYEHLKVQIRPEYRENL